MRYSDDVVAGPGYEGVSLVDGSGGAVSITKTLVGCGLRVRADAGLVYSTSYTLTVPALAVQDKLGLSPDSEYTVSFATAGPPDLTAPTVTGSNPVQGATGVAVGSDITITCSESVAAGPLYERITLVDGTGKAVAFAKSVSGATLTAHPSSKLANNTSYTLTVPAGALQDAAENWVESDYGLSFTTEPPLSVVSTDPASGATGVQVTATVRVVYNRAIKLGPNAGGIKLTKSGKTVVFTANVSGDTLLIDPNSNMSFSTVYQVYVPIGAVTDLAGSASLSSLSFSFTTQKR